MPRKRTGPASPVADAIAASSRRTADLGIKRHQLLGELAAVEADLEAEQKRLAGLISGKVTPDALPTETPAARPAHALSGAA